MILKNILIYLCFVALGYVFYLLFVGYLSFYVLLVVILFPLFSFVLLLLNIHHSHLSFVQDKKTIVQDEKTFIKIKKETLSLGFCRVKILDKEYLLKKDINDLEISYSHCGGWQLAIGKYKQYDILNIFFLKKKSLESIDITVLPKEIEYDFTTIKSTLPKQSDEVYSTTQKGDDPTEIFDIHEYHEGDSLKNIHWKLSVKHQKLLIKENALPIQENVCIQCFFYNNDDDNDLVFQYLHFFCQYLLQHHHTFVLANQIIRYEEQYRQVLSQLLWLKKDISNHTKSPYQYFIDKEGIHFMKR